jgi:Flp pilus assembly protein TadB
MMGAILLLAVALGLAQFSFMSNLRRYSARAHLVSRMGREPVLLEVSPVNRRLATWLRQVSLTRNLSVTWFRYLQGALAGTSLLLVSGPWLLFTWPISLGWLLVSPPLLWVLPEAWLWLQVGRRRTQLGRAYPDLLAHLVMQTRAGASTLQAFASSPPVLREPLRCEVEELIADLRIAPLPAALERFAQRCNTSAIETFVQNVIYQQSVGIALPDVLVNEEAHAMAMAKQLVRQRIQGSAITMAAVTVILLLNALLIYFTPMMLDLNRILNIAR